MLHKEGCDHGTELLRGLFFGLDYSEAECYTKKHRSLLHSKHIDVGTTLFRRTQR